jgi:hypothetical protein
MKVRWAVNDDLENEFRYWLRELLAALKQAAVFAFATGVLIACLPGGTGNLQAAFVHDFWPYLVELAFWFGMFVAMAWSAIKRAATVVTGVLPWETEKERAAAAARDE